MKKKKTQTAKEKEFSIEKIAGGFRILLKNGNQVEIGVSGISVSPSV